MDEAPRFSPREQRLSLHLDAAQRQLEQAGEDGDKEIAAAWRRLVDELERLTFGDDGEAVPE